MKIELEELKRRQALPLEQKIEMSQCVIETWWKHWDEKVYVAFSGGKDSTILLHLVRSLFPNVMGVFSDTGLEYPEIKEFIKQQENITIIKPDYSFREVVQKYGYPVVSKSVATAIRTLRHQTDKNKKTTNLRLTGYTSAGRYLPLMKLPQKWKKLINAPFETSEKCCQVLKKDPFIKFNRKTGMLPYIGIMASDSEFRKKTYLTRGCSIFEGTHRSCNPLSFWTTNDILEYSLKNNLKICSIYGDIVNKNEKFELTGVKRTGCMWCMFGVHLEKEPNRFQLMKQTHPKLYEYCINDLELGKILDYIGVNYK